MTGRRWILHVDMDAFFVSVELLDRPELRGRPVVVGGVGNRGVVASASYEARSYGVRSAMPSVTARRLCPDAVFLDGRHDRYSEVSARIMSIFGRFTPLVEPLSLDEAFLDVTGALRVAGPASVVASGIRAAVADEEGLGCAVGIAPNKSLAKLASQRAKPRPSRRGPVAGAGVFEVTPDEVGSFLDALPMSAMWGVGPATAARLSRVGVTTVEQCRRLDLPSLQSAVGRSAGARLHDLCRGIDDRPVVADLAAKSIGHEQTFAVDLTDPLAVDTELVRQADSVVGRLRSAGLAAGVVSVKVRDHQFATTSRSITLDAPADELDELLGVARQLLAGLDTSRGVRLLGVSTSGLVDADRPRQLELSWDRTEPRDGSRSRVVDEIRARYGVGSIGPARLVAGAGGNPVVRPGEARWGPGDG